MLLHVSIIKETILEWELDIILITIRAILFKNKDFEPTNIYFNVEKDFGIW